MNAIEFEKVDFAYSGHKVLDRLDFAVPSSRFTALLGANGAGKTTILNLITGLLVPDSGEIRINGLINNEKTLAVRRCMGVVFQQSVLDQELNPMQNLRYFAGLFGVPAGQEAFLAHLARFGVDHLADKPVRTLSGGQKRRVEIAQALLHKPNLLILDEPTAGLDIASKTIITDYVHRLASEGVSVLWITHLLDELNDDDHVILLDSGKRAEAGTFKALGGARRLTETYRQQERASL